MATKRPLSQVFIAVERTVTVERLALWFISLVLAGVTPSLAQKRTTADSPLAILLAAGDIAKCTAKRDEATAKVLEREIESAKKAKVRVHVLALGDLAYDGGTRRDFKCFESSWGKPAIYPYLLPVPGNHDVQEHRNAKPYFDFFANLPIVHESRSRGGYYAVEITNGDQPAWRIYGLNAYAGFSASSDQLRWLDKDLEANKAPCVLAFWHPFLFSSGHWGHNRSRDPNAPTKRLDMSAAPFNLLYRNGGSVVLTAHDHDFEQFKRLDPDGNADEKGVRSFVVGTGGAPLYRDVVYRKKAPGSEKYDQDSHGVLRVDLYPNRYEWSFLPIEGATPITLDPSTDNCNERR